jgi:hypothetical protein
MRFCLKKKKITCWESGAHACSHNYLGSWDQESQCSKPAQGTSLRDSISKITRAKWTGGMIRVVEHLLYKCEVLSSNSSPTKIK